MGILGIDIGGSGIKGCLVDVEQGQLETPRFRLETPPGARPDEMAAVVREVVSHFDYKGPVGYGFPAVVPLPTLIKVGSDSTPLSFLKVLRNARHLY